jgi:hypothetical protein
VHVPCCVPRYSCEELLDLTYLHFISSACGSTDRWSPLKHDICKMDESETILFSALNTSTIKYLQPQQTYCLYLDFCRRRTSALKAICSQAANIGTYLPSSSKPLDRIHFSRAMEILRSNLPALSFRSNSTMA